jgi:hypothetical protein
MAVIHPPSPSQREDRGSLWTGTCPPKTIPYSPQHIIITGINKLSSNCPTAVESDEGVVHGEIITIASPINEMLRPITVLVREDDIHTPKAIINNGSQNNSAAPSMLSISMPQRIILINITLHIGAVVHFYCIIMCGMHIYGPCVAELLLVFLW